MTEYTDLLIVGAGPTGLATALFLTRKGHRPRIIDKAETISPHSKALGVNVRTLRLLESTGVTDRFLQNGRQMKQLKLRRHDRILTTLRLDEVDETYPFMLVQSQADSERMLEDALTREGITVERGTCATSIEIEGNIAIVRLTGPRGEETVRARAVLGADGADSTIRKTLGFSFDGQAYKEPWRLWDLELKVPLDTDDAHIFLLDKGGMFVVRHSDNLWRVLGAGPDLLESLPSGTKIGPVHWQSEFRISNRVAGSFSKGPVYLAGDAAHIHAGIGARGMNLGIEDAYVFAELFHKGELNRFDSLRRPVVNKVVADITRMMSVPRADTMPGRIVRAMPWLVSAVVPAFRAKIQPWVLGLDHEVKV